MSSQGTPKKQLNPSHSATKPLYHPNKSSAAAKNFVDQFNKGCAHYERGEIKDALKCHTHAEKAFEQKLEASEKELFYKEIAIVKNQLANMLHGSDASIAKIKFEEANKFFNHPKFGKYSPDTYRMRAKNHVALGALCSSKIGLRHIEQSRKIFLTALMELELLESTDRQYYCRNRALVLADMGEVLLLAKDEAGHQNYLKQAIALFEEIQNNLSPEELIKLAQWKSLLPHSNNDTETEVSDSKNSNAENSSATSTATAANDSPVTTSATASAPASEEAISAHTLSSAKASKPKPSFKNNFLGQFNKGYQHFSNKEMKEALNCHKEAEKIYEQQLDAKEKNEMEVFIKMAIVKNQLANILQHSDKAAARKKFKQAHGFFNDPKFGKHSTNAYRMWAGNNILWGQLCDNPTVRANLCTGAKALYDKALVDLETTKESNYIDYCRNRALVLADTANLFLSSNYKKEHQEYIQNAIKLFEEIQSHLSPEELEKLALWKKSISSTTTNKVASVDSKENHAGTTITQPLQQNTAPTSLTSADSTNFSDTKEESNTLTTVVFDAKQFADLLLAASNDDYAHIRVMITKFGKDAIEAILLDSINKWHIRNSEKECLMILICLHLPAVITNAELPNIDAALNYLTALKLEYDEKMAKFKFQYNGPGKAKSMTLIDKSVLQEIFQAAATLAQQNKTSAKHIRITLDSQISKILANIKTNSATAKSSASSNDAKENSTTTSPASADAQDDASLEEGEGEAVSDDEADIDAEDLEDEIDTLTEEIQKYPYVCRAPNGRFTTQLPTQAIILQITAEYSKIQDQGSTVAGELMSKATTLSSILALKREQLANKKPNFSKAHEPTLDRRNELENYKNDYGVFTAKVAAAEVTLNSYLQQLAAIAKQIQTSSSTEDEDLSPTTSAITNVVTARSVAPAQSTAGDSTAAARPAQHQAPPAQNSTPASAFWRPVNKGASPNNTSNSTLQNTNATMAHGNKQATGKALAGSVLPTTDFPPLSAAVAASSPLFSATPTQKGGKKKGLTPVSDTTATPATSNRSSGEVGSSAPKSSSDQIENCAPLKIPLTINNLGNVLPRPLFW